MNGGNNKPTTGIISFESYGNEVYQNALFKINKLLNEKSLVPQFERLALKVVYVLEHKISTFPQDKTGEYIRHALTKMTNEMFSTIGCIRSGSLLGANHHIRGLIELNAALYYVFNPSDIIDTAKRIEKFFEYTSLYRYQHRKKLENELRNQQISQKEFDERNLLHDAGYAEFTSERVLCWQKLYGVKSVDKLLKIKHWHHPDPISNLIKRVNMSRDYAMLCQPTHFSSIGKNLAGGGFKLFGFGEENLRIVDANIVTAYGNIWNILNAVDSRTPDGWIMHFRPEITDLINQNSRT